jgi:hypothetical protein
MLDPIFVVMRFGSADKQFVSGCADKSKRETICDTMIYTTTNKALQSGTSGGDRHKRNRDLVP